MHYNDWQVAESEDEWLEKQIESEKSISALEQQIRQLKVTSHIADDFYLILVNISLFICFVSLIVAFIAVACLLFWVPAALFGDEMSLSLRSVVVPSFLVGVFIVVWTVDMCSLYFKQFSALTYVCLCHFL